MATPEREVWPSEPVAPEHYLIAFGQFTLVYNMLENVTGHIFEKCAPLDGDFAKALFHDLNNRKRVDLLSAFVRKNENDPEVRDTLLHFIMCYDICTDNRNVLMHSTYFDIGETSGARLVKRAAKNPNREIHFEVQIADLRLVADQLVDTFGFAVELYGFVSRRNWLKENPQSTSSNTAPKRPPKPLKLIQYQP